MSQSPSAAWFHVFPGPRIPDVLSYVTSTWAWLRVTYVSAVSFDKSEPTLTDNLCEALNDADRKYAARMDCDFQAETRELRRQPDGTTTYIARADIRVILGVPGTPHFVIEFKKLDGTTQARYAYCFDGLSRFVEGKYAVGHAYGAMCGLTSQPAAAEATAMAAYISDAKRAARLECVTYPSALATESPSSTDPINAQFDTIHNRTAPMPRKAIKVVHVMVDCQPPLANAAKAVQTIKTAAVMKTKTNKKK